MMGGNTKTPTATVNADPVVANTDSATPQVINLEYTSAGLSGNINVKKGKSYKIVINVKDTISGCMHMILIPGMDENAQPLDAGNVVTFNITPKQTGKFPLTCAMGVPHGYITVE
jgi:plastocyanin domain-containing protein